MTLPQPPLLVITDRGQAHGLLERVVHQVLAGGCRWISLREKDLEPTERLMLLQRLLALAHNSDATIGIHADVETAYRTGIPHIHLPAGANPAEVRNQLGKDVLIGVSAHTLAEVKAAERNGADYCTLSPIFASRSKPGYGPALGIEGLAWVARRVSIPLIALGGIEVNNLGDCLAAGAAGIAVMGNIMRADNPRLQTRHYLAGLLH